MSKSMSMTGLVTRNHDRSESPVHPNNASHARDHTPQDISETHRKSRDHRVDDFTRRLAGRIGPQRYDMWFGHSTRFEMSGDTLEVTAQSRFLADWIGQNFSDHLRTTVRETFGDHVSVDVRVAPNKSTADSAGATPPSPARAATTSTGGGGAARHGGTSTDSGDGRQRRPSSPPSLRHLRDLESFVVGQSNELAYRAACCIAEPSPQAQVSLLFLHGDCGVGKTHLLQGICRHYGRRLGRPGAMKYVTGEQFTNEYITAVRSGNIDAFRRRYRRVELLAIDDVHFLANKVGTQSEFLHTIDSIGLSGSRLVLASDEHPRDISRFSRALVSRFLSGLVVKIDRPDITLRTELTHRLARARQLRINDAAVDQLASRCNGSVRELEGALTKLAAMHQLLTPGGGAQEIGVMMIEQLFATTWRPAAPVRLESIMDAVCNRLGVERAELKGNNRHRQVVLARELITYLARELASRSFPEIARAFGRKHHSTFHAADKRVRDMVSGAATVRVGNRSSVPLTELLDSLTDAICRPSRS